MLEYLKGVYMGQEIEIDLLKKNMKIIQRNDHFNFSIDSLLISDFVRTSAKLNLIYDIGTGNGVIPLFLSKKCNARIVGIEIQEISATLALRNVMLNNLEERISIINEDIKKIAFNKVEKADVVVSNPPFFKFNGATHLLNNLESFTLARHEISLTLDELVSCASLLLKETGYFYLVHRVDRLEEIMLTLSKYNFSIKRMRFCYTTENKNAKIVLIESLKNGNSGLTILRPLVINKENGDYTDEVKEMFY